MSDSATANIGVIGLAVMGSNLARNLARHGHTVAVFNRTHARTLAHLEAQISAYADVGYFGETKPPAVEGRYDPDLVKNLYDDKGSVIWPG